MKDDGSSFDAEGELLEMSFGPGTIAEDLQKVKTVEIANHISSSLMDLRKMALTFKMKLLVYLLEMAYQEAYLQVDPPPGGGKGK